MSGNKSAQVLVGALNLLAVASPLVGQAALASTPLDHKIEIMNAASLTSIESTWLRVPAACKARGFNAAAVRLEAPKASAQVQDIYSSFEV